MTPEPAPDSHDNPLMDLFRSEVDTHSAIIREILTSLKTDPTATADLETARQSAHTIKGGGLILELADAVQLAHAIETSLIAYQGGKIAIDSGDIDVLLQAIQMLVRFSRAALEPDTEQSNPATLETSRIIELIDHIKNRSASNSSPSSRPIPKAGSVPVPPVPSAIETRASIPNIRFSVPKLGDESMLDMYRTEIDTHLGVLTEGLLSLENDPGATDRIESMMRAAHSIKGGSRVIELDAAVQIAHVMEDCFVAAQKNQLFLAAESIDILLRGVDMLRSLSDSLGEGITEWLTGHQVEIQNLAAAISGILTGEKIEKAVLKRDESNEAASLMPALSGIGNLPVPSAPASPERAVDTQAVSVQRSEFPVSVTRDEGRSVTSQTDDKDRMVRVTAAKIEKLMGLTGEVVVSARWLPPFFGLLLMLKKNQNDLFSVIEKLRESWGKEGNEDHVREQILKAREKNRECNLLLSERLNDLDMFINTSTSLSERLYHEVIGVRMRPFADGIKGFPRMVRDLSRTLGKKVKLDIIGKSTQVDRDILEKLDAPLTHILRNAMDHGLESPDERMASEKPETGTIWLEATHRAGMLLITIADDGRGIELNRFQEKIVQKGLATHEMVKQMTESELLDFLFLPGFSTAATITEISGRGVGLDVVRNMVTEVGGRIRVSTEFGKGTSFHLELPLTLSVIRTFLVEIDSEIYAFPLARIERCVLVPLDQVETVEDRQYFRLDQVNIAIMEVRDIFEMGKIGQYVDQLPIVVVSDRSHAYGLMVDKFIGECDLVVRPLDSRLGKIPDISAAAIMLDGSPVLICDVEDMIHSIENILSGRRMRKAAFSEEPNPSSARPVKKILVVDDSITVREMERKILENRGYSVEIGVDGMDGWNAVRSDTFNLVISDIDMPRMNGIAFVTRIKNDDSLKTLPVIIVSYKDTEEYRMQGLEAGADYYLTKSSFQDDTFIDAVIALIGEP